MKRTWLLIVALGLFLFILPAYADWTAAKRLTWNSGDSMNPDLAVDSEFNFHVVWYDKTPGPSEIYYRRSTDLGISWSPMKRLTWTADDSYDPDIAIDSSDALHVVWYDYTPGLPDIYYRRSADGGLTWSTTQRLTWTSGWSYNPAIAIDSSGALYVVWSEEVPGTIEVYYRKSTNGGTTWSSPQRLSWNSGDSFFPAIALDSGDDLHVVWEDFTPGYAEIYYKRSTDGGATWSAEESLTSTSGSSCSPAMAATLVNTLHVVWRDGTPGNEEIYYKKSGNGGLTWSADKRITWTSGDSYFPAIAINSGTTIHVVWHDSTPGTPDLYYRRSADGGTSWSPVQRLTWNLGTSYKPDIAVDGSGSVHIVWADDTPGNYEIFHKSGK